MELGMNSHAGPNRVSLDARFSWDNGRGETQCSSVYLERRNFHRMAAGRAAEARLLGKIELAASFEEQARRLGREMEELQKVGHVGASKNFHQGEFRAAFDSARFEDLKIV